MTMLQADPLHPFPDRTGEPGAPAGRGASDRAKRALDVTLALAMLAFLSPAIVVVVAAMLVADGRPLCFAHTRVGKDGRRFACLKFRTMCRDAPERLEALLASCPDARREWEACRKLTRDPRVHPLGDFLRRSSLDEIPQLVNVLRGEMSLVGPRPVTEDELGLYKDAAAHYLAQRPGVTGLWQVSGRSDTTYRERVELDTRYARTRSLPLDLRILCRTVIVVLAMRGSR